MTTDSVQRPSQPHDSRLTHQERSDTGVSGGNINPVSAVYQATNLGTAPLQVVNYATGDLSAQEVPWNTDGVTLINNGATAIQQMVAEYELAI